MLVKPSVRARWPRLAPFLHWPAGANRAFVANPLQNATGIPAGLTDFAMSLVEPAAVSKLAKLADLPALMDTVSSAADLPTTGKVAQARQLPQNQYLRLAAATMFSTPQDSRQRQIQRCPAWLAQNPFQKFRRKLPPQKSAVPAPPSADKFNAVPMTGGEASQDANLQRLKLTRFLARKARQRSKP
ncbi:unnamed protein product [Sphagnum balticum]